MTLKEAGMTTGRVDSRPMGRGPRVIDLRGSDDRESVGLLCYYIFMSEDVIVIAGPTCVGKTEAAVLLAELIGTEIISADSMQVYRHMDIGTEKPTPAQRQRVRHHLIDIVEPSGGYSAGRFIEDAAPVIEKLLSEGKPPLVVGGTGLYIRAMTRGLFKGPSADRALRDELLREEAEAPGLLYARLMELDPEAAGKIMPSDLRRALRAIEVCLKGRRKFSEMTTALTAPLPYRFLKIGLLRQRPELYRMIEQRVDEMFRAGLVEEVRNVLTMNPSQTAMQAIGYKEIVGHLRGQYGLDEAVRLIKRNTKRYAKRQFTWFKKEEGMHWVDMTGIRDAQEALKKLLHEVPGLYDIIIRHGKSPLPRPQRAAEGKVQEDRA